MEREYNDEREFATVFQLGDTVTGNLSNSADIDWFAVDISGDQTGMVKVNFDVSAITSSLSFWNVEWFDPSMQIMSGRNIEAPDGFQYQFPAFTVGTYYLRVRVTETIFYSGGPYKVTLTKAP